MAWVLTFCRVTEEPIATFSPDDGSCHVEKSGAVSLSVMDPNTGDVRIVRLAAAQIADLARKGGA